VRADDWLTARERVLDPGIWLAFTAWNVRDAWIARGWDMALSATLAITSAWFCYQSVERAMQRKS
jgi:hypothetical protein